jgi:uncharacterized protein
MSHEARRDDDIPYEKVLAEVMDRSPLGPGSFIYGPNHWYRVETIGMRIARENGADIAVVRLFSLFHDSQRTHESDDADHGKRGAELAKELRGVLYELEDDRFEKLYYAIEHHEAGQTSDDVTIGTCWDADRLDQARLGREVDEDLLSTEDAKDEDLFDWAVELYLRSQP